MSNRILSFVLLVGLPLGACSDDLDRERLRLADFDQRVGTIASLETVDGMTAEAGIPGTRRESGRPGDGGDDSIERIVGSLTEGRAHSIDLMETRRATLVNNLGLQSTLIVPEIASQELRAEEAKFEATFNTSITAQRMVSPISTPIVGLQNSTTETVSVAPSVNVPLRTGGSIDLDWTVSSQNSSYENETQEFSASRPGLRLEQPLLRGGGIAYNEASIVIAEANLGEQRSQAQVAVINELVQSETAYWNLYRSWKVLQVNLGLYATARDLLENQRRQTELMNSSVANVYNFEVALAVSAETVLQSELEFRRAVRTLKVVIQNPDLELEAGLTLMPTTEPRLVGYEFDAEKLVQFAMRNRAELLELEYERVRSSIEVLMRDNETLPQLDLLASWNLNGFTDASNSYWRATEDFGDEPDGWMVGVNLSVPLGNDVAISNLQAALLARMRAIADLRQRRITVTAEVLDAIDALETGWDRILTSQYQVQAAERFYDAYKLLFQRGEIPSSNLTEALQARSSAQLQKVQAEVEYQIRFADLAQAVGCLMGHAGVNWASNLELERFDRPPAYSPMKGITPNSERLDESGPTLESLMKETPASSPDAGSVGEELETSVPDAATSDPRPKPDSD